MRIFFFSITMTSLLIITSFLCYVLFSLLYPFNALMVKNSTSLAVVSKSVEAGSNVEFLVDYCKYWDIKPLVRKEIIGEFSLVSIPPLPENRQLPSGCHKVFINHTVPIITPTGKYRIFIFLEYKINTFRSVTYTLTTEEFFVNNAKLP